jgi:hypothetical protein
VTAALVDVVSIALEKMRRYDYSQLPVVDTAGHPRGLLTHASILRALSHVNVPLDKLLAELAMDRAYPRCEVDDNLSDLLENLRDNYAVMVVDAQKKLFNIVTSHDATEFFRRRAEDMMYIEDIEGTMKKIVPIAFAGADGRVDEESLKVVVARTMEGRQEKRQLSKAVVNRYLRQGGGNFDADVFDEVFEQTCKPKREPTLDNLTFGELKRIFLDEERWERLRDKSGLERDVLDGLLELAGSTRNKLAHFRGAVEHNESDCLRYCCDVLSRMLEQLSPRKELGLTLAIDSNSPGASPEEDPTSLVESGPFIEADRPGDSRYDQLALHLQRVTPLASGCVLHFEDIESLIQGRLPDSARKHLSWWESDSLEQGPSRHWLDVGWTVERVDIDAQRVYFTPIRERSRRYTHFFEGLLSELKKKASFPLREANVSGVSWVWVSDFPTYGRANAHLGFSFALRKRFRVELYIDNRDPKFNKRMFDELHAHRAEIESEIGMSIQWERLDHRRASRIAIYRDGSITDDQARLEELRSWAVDTMVRLHKALAKRIA